MADLMAALRASMERAKEERSPKLAYCESVHAGPFSRWHIRRVGPEGLKLGGGAPDTVLCGRSINKGWDLRLPVNNETLARLRNDTLCHACVLAAVPETRHQGGHL